jgi:hypothetical protein
MKKKKTTKEKRAERAAELAAKRAAKAARNKAKEEQKARVEALAEDVAKRTWTLPHAWQRVTRRLSRLGESKLTKLHEEWVYRDSLS